MVIIHSLIQKLPGSWINPQSWYHQKVLCCEQLMEKCFRFKNTTVQTWSIELICCTFLHLFCTSCALFKRSKNSFSNKCSWRPGRYLSSANLSVLFTVHVSRSPKYFLKYFICFRTMNCSTPKAQESQITSLSNMVCLFFLTEIESWEHLVHLVSGQLNSYQKNWWRLT